MGLFPDGRMKPSSDTAIKKARLIPGLMKKYWSPEQIFSVGKANYQGYQAHATPLWAPNRAALG
jgi:hypothetical protein